MLERPDGGVASRFGKGVEMSGAGGPGQPTMLGDVIRGFLFVVITLGGVFGALGVVVGLVERDMGILVVYLVWSVVFAILGALVFWWIKSSRSPTKRGVVAGRRLSAYPPGRPQPGVPRPQAASSGPVSRPGELGSPPGGPEARTSRSDARRGGPDMSKPSVDERHSAPTRTAGPVRRSDVGAPLTPPPVRPVSRPPLHSPSADTHADNPVRRSSPITPPARPVAPSDPTIQQSFPDER